MVCYGAVVGLAARSDAGGKSLIAPRSGRLVRRANHGYQPHHPNRAVFRASPPSEGSSVKRLLITGPKQAVFEEVERPDCGPEEVVVRAKVTAISTGTELRVFRAIPVDEAGHFLHERVPFALPVENGYSMVGEIVEVGSLIQGLQIGDRVFVPAPHKEFAAVKADLVTPLPDCVADDEAVLLSILEVAHRALRQGEPPAGGNLAIVGQGVVGLSVLAYAVAFGFRTAVLDFSSERLEIAQQMGAGLAVSPNDSAVPEKVVEFFDGEGADVVFEAASHWSAVRSAMEIARLDGKVVLVSRHTARPEFNPAGHPFLGKRLNLVTSYDYPPAGHRWSRPRSLALTMHLLAQQRLNLRPMLTHSFDWCELPDYYRRLDQGELGVVAAVAQWNNSNTEQGMSNDE